MNIIELQENFEIACFYYASQSSPVASLFNLMQVEFVKNPIPETGKPNYFKSIKKWNHSSQKPTDDQLLALSLVTVKNFYNQSQKNLDEFLSLPVFYSLKDSKLFVIIDGVKKEIQTQQ